MAKGIKGMAIYDGEERITLDFCYFLGRLGFPGTGQTTNNEQETGPQLAFRKSSKRLSQSIASFYLLLCRQALRSLNPI